ncbi:MAG: polysaccharide deacetylase family protein [Desulfobacteraceae bacterium]|nr:polysaccharide deacetylase family protein [Desulfobacteraceae bacterium]
MKAYKYTNYRQQANPILSSLPRKLRRYLRYGLLSVVSVTNKSMKDKFLRCLYCHNVFDNQRSKFEKILLKLKKIGAFVDTDTCIKMIQGKKQIDGRYFHLSFDDGFQNNYTNAFPILKKHSIPAIIFIPSSLIGADYNKNKIYCLDTTGYNSVIKLLTWKEIRDMASAGYTIGSHTKTHKCFSTTSKDKTRLKDEIYGSKIEIENHLDQECKYISWPYGRLSDADKESLAMVKDAGYLSCFGAFRGAAAPNYTDLFSIPRHQFEVQWPLSHIEYFARGNMEVSGENSRPNIE